MRRPTTASRKVPLLFTGLLLASGCASTRASIPLPTVFRPEPVAPVERVVASWYGAEFAGKTTASGERFDPDGFTCAHPDLPFGTVIRLHNPRNGATAVVTVNDRGPFVPGRDLDLSHAAARRLGLVAAGVAELDLEILERRDESTAEARTDDGSVFGE